MHDWAAPIRILDIDIMYAEAAPIMVALVQPQCSAPNIICELIDVMIESDDRESTYDASGAG